MKKSLLLCLLFCSSALLAHTPVSRCELRNQQIECEGGYHDGSKAIGVAMRVMSYNGQSLAIGEFDANSRFNTALPQQPFYILMDVGLGEVFELDWRDIGGIDQQHFLPTDPKNSHID